MRAVLKPLSEQVIVITGANSGIGLVNAVTHHARLEDSPAVYEIFRDKRGGCDKIVLKP